MQKDKHNIYSKEELLKMLQEGTPAPENMDAFDLEALEGLKLLNDPSLLNKLENEVDAIVLAEKKKENKKRTIYYFSAAASLLLIIGLVFFFKNEVVVKSDKVVASVEKPKEENTQLNLQAPAPAEAKPDYEAKEQEPTVKKAINQSDNRSSVSQPSVHPVLSDKEEEAKDLDKQLEEKKLTSNGYSSAQDSKAAAPSQLKQEQESIPANEDHVAGNAFGAGAVIDKSKQKNDAALSLSQPATQAFSKSAKDAEVSSEPNKVVSAKKNKTTAAFYADESVKKTEAKNYKEPAFPGRDSAFVVYAKQNLKISSSSNSGIIVVSFVVNKKGEAENIIVISPLSNCETCSKDVINLIKSVKKWQPALMNGDPISAPKKISIQYN